MAPPVCSAPLPWPALVGYWLADPTVDGEAVEEHLFSCAECSQRLAGLVGLSEGLRRWFSGESVQPVVTREMLANVVSRGLRVMEFLVPAGERRTVPIPDHADIVVARLPAELTGAERLDVEICVPHGAPFFVVRDAPFEASSGEVLLLCHRATAASNPQLLIRVIARYSDERVIVSEHTLVSQQE